MLGCLYYWGKGAATLYAIFIGGQEMQKLHFILSSFHTSYLAKGHLLAL